MSADIVSEARARIDRIRTLVGAARLDLIEAWRQRDWVTLGYDTWDAMCEAEFAGARIALPIEERQQIVSDLRSEGMSTRAIASAVGVSKDTVHRDLSGVSDETPHRPMLGLDGKTYPPPRPKVDDDADRHALLSPLASDPDVIAARRRHNLSRYLTHTFDPIADPDELARIAPDFEEQIDRSLTHFQTWVKAYKAALPNRLQIVKENR